MILLIFCILASGPEKLLLFVSQINMLCASIASLSAMYLGALWIDFPMTRMFLATVQNHRSSTGPERLAPSDWPRATGPERLARSAFDSESKFPKIATRITSKISVLFETLSCLERVESL